LKLINLLAFFLLEIVPATCTPMGCFAKVTGTVHSIDNHLGCDCQLKLINMELLLFRVGLYAIIKLLPVGCPPFFITILSGQPVRGIFLSEQRAIDSSSNFSRN
jgi:hypothetical protein